jgi:hypothetical protein
MPANGFSRYLKTSRPGHPTVRSDVKNSIIFGFPIMRFQLPDRVCVWGVHPIAKTWH